MKKVLGLILAAVMLLSALPAAAIAEEPETTATVTEVNEKGQKGTIVNCKTAVNVRAKASSKSKSLGKAKKGETFTVKGASGNWIKIDFNGKDGYVFKRYISVKGTPDDTPVEGKTGRIINCKTAANVRAKASSKSKLLGTAKRGKTFKVLATAGSWVKIQYNKETAGYVYKKYIQLFKEGSETPSGNTATIVNCKIAVNVRAKASSSAKILGTAAKGAVYSVLGISGNWVKIDFDGKTGFVFHRYVKLSDEEEAIKGKKGTIRCNTHVNIRAKATKNSKLLGTAKNGDTFTVQGRSGNWIKIDYKGKTGFVYKKYIRIG